MIESLIAAGAAILVCLLNNWWMDKRRTEQTQTTIAIITEKIESLTKQVEKHNQVIERVYELEAGADVLDERIKVANHRLDDLERGTQQ